MSQMPPPAVSRGRDSLLRARRALLALPIFAWAACGMGLVSQTPAAESDPVLLWPEGAPGAMGTEPADQPTIRIYLAPADKATGTAIVICPGGGYGALAIDHEGHHIAQWLNSIGVTGVVLKYRLGPKYHHPAPLQDVQRAIRFVRAHAAEFGLAADRVGVMGFSAGGHLASTAATHYDTGEPSAADPIERASCRPDFAILCYPVISLKSDFGHKGSLRNLLGETPDAALVENLSNETQVTEDTPPTFLFHTSEDKAVPVQNALVFYRALVENGVPAELHVYQNGPHGIGLATGDPVVSSWQERLHAWLQTNGSLATVQRAAVKGLVTLNGQPVTRGTIAFFPVRASKSEESRLPVAFSSIARGRYDLPEFRGPVIGECRVSIVTFGTGDAAGSIAAAGPVVHHDKADLKANVVGDPADDEFNFELKTDR
jgi:acetyl esterase/lipase